MGFGIDLAPAADSWRVVKRAEELDYARAWFLLGEALPRVERGERQVATSRFPQPTAGETYPRKRWSRDPLPGGTIGGALFLDAAVHVTVGDVEIERTVGAAVCLEQASLDLIRRRENPAAEKQGCVAGEGEVMGRSQYL